MRRKFLVCILLWLAVLKPASATTNVIANAYFYGGSPNTYSPWQATGAGVTPGPDYMSMGNYANVGQYVFQSFMFPSNMIGATLSLQNETLSTYPSTGDTLSIYLMATNLNEYGDPYYVFEQIGGTVSSEDTTSGYDYGSTNFIPYVGSNILSGYAGGPADLVFYVATDSYGYYSQFNISDVSLVAGTLADIPSNDEFENAMLIPPTGITNEVPTTYASLETGEPEIAGVVGGHSLWWTWTAPGIGTVTISTAGITTAGSAYATLLGVYTGSSLTNLMLITNSDGAKLSGGMAAVKFNTIKGTQYQIALDGYEGQSGTADFTFRYSTDTTPPKVVIKSPTTGSVVTSPTMTVAGTASDNIAVAAVYYRLENADGTNAWQLATGTNTWSATVSNLIAGPNTVRVEAYDTSSNEATATCLLNYVMYAPVGLTIVGEGHVSGATNGQLLKVGYPYKFTAAPVSGFGFVGWTGDFSTNGKILSFTFQSNVTVTANFADIEKPTLSISAPVAKQRWSNDVFQVTGKASDNVGVASIWYQVNTGAWSNNVPTANRWTNWSVGVALNPGTNVIKAYSVDGAGNISLTSTVSFLYIVSSTLTLQTVGHGTLSPNYTNALLAIGTNYTMTAKAGSGYVFSNWMAGANVVTNGPILKFLMTSNLSLTANFVTNPFISVAGTYQGLFYNTNEQELTMASSGFFSAVVENTGSFTAEFQQGAKTYSESGKFLLTGGWSTNALRTWGNTGISLQLDLTGGNMLTGQLSNPAWTASVGANLTLFSKTTKAPFAGDYTFLIPGTNAPGEPGGDGFGSVVVSSGGLVSLGATLGDGTTVTRTAYESSQGEWPLYISLDSGAGMLMGWLVFTNESDRDIDGQLQWFKPAQTSATTYKAGFTNQYEASGSTYVYDKGARILDLTSGVVLLEGGGLEPSIVDPFTLSAANVVKGTDKLSVTLTTGTGLFKGSATNAAGKTVTFSGAVFQKQGVGLGQFVNGTQTGSVQVMSPAAGTE